VVKSRILVDLNLRRNRQIEIIQDGDTFQMTSENLTIQPVSSFEKFAKTQSQLFQETYSYCIGKIQPHEVSWAKQVANEIAKQTLTTLYPNLASRLALGKDVSAVARSIFEELTVEQIGKWVQAMVNKPEPVWAKLIPPFFKSLLRGASYSIINNVFEIDYAALEAAHTTEAEGALCLALALCLCIPDSEAKGNLFDKEE
jgi:hypothetical protein